jgi:peptidoglycan/LPS O-acetylase OafA/YrhL
VLNPTHTSAKFVLPKYMPAIDGLRAFAVLAVLLVHFPYPGHYALFQKLHLTRSVEAGWMGVDLFFVISGFLITGILLDLKGSPHYFRNFYVRRALRIWPLYYAVLFLVLVIYPIVNPNGSMVHRTAPWFYYVFYIQNFISYGSRLLGVTWSLAVEEQFYTTWPFIVSALNKKNFQRLVVTLLLAAPVIRLIARPYVGSAFTLLTFWRMDGILAGSLLALWFRSGNISIPRLRKVAIALLLVGSAGSIRLLIASGQKSVFLFSCLAMAFSGLLCFAAVESILPRPCRSLLNNSWLRYIGRISYGMYLLHPIVYQGFYFLIYKLGVPVRDTFWQDAISLVVEVGLVIAAASVSWYFFEKPISGLKKRFEPVAPTAAHPQQDQQTPWGYGQHQTIR